MTFDDKGQLLFEDNPKPLQMDILKKSAIDREKLREAFELARELNLKSIEVDGIKMEIPLKEEPIPEADIPQPTTPFDNLSEEEVLFYSVPYFDELLAAKEERAKALEEEGYVR